jgi:hypothetical protein
MAVMKSSISGLSSIATAITSAIGGRVERLNATLKKSRIVFVEGYALSPTSRDK